MTKNLLYYGDNLDILTLDKLKIKFMPRYKTESGVRIGSEDSFEF